MGADCETPVQPRFSIKAGYYFSDVPDPSFAPTWVVPGSHHREGSEQLLRPESGQPGVYAKRRSVFVCVVLTTALLLQMEPSRFSAKRTVLSSSTDVYGIVLRPTTAHKRGTLHLWDMGA